MSFLNNVQTPTTPSSNYRGHHVGGKENAFSKQHEPMVSPKFASSYSFGKHNSEHNHNRPFSPMKSPKKSSTNNNTNLSLISPCSAKKKHQHTNSNNKTTFTTPSSSSTKKKLSMMNSPSPSKMLMNSVTVSSSEKKKNYSNGGGDRFIADRSRFRVDLCRAGMLSAEKRRKQVEDSCWKLGADLNTAVVTPSPYNHNHNNSSNSSSSSLDANNNSSSSGSREVLTPLQTEFRKRMMGALLNLPIDEVGGARSSTTDSIRGTSSSSSDHLSSTANNNNSTTANDVNNNNTNTRMGEDGVIRNMNESSSSSRRTRDTLFEGSSPYATIPGESRDDYSSSAECLGTRMLSFRESPHHKSSNTLTTSSSLSTNTTSRRTYSDPFCHDQLRVLNRSSSGSALVNPLLSGGSHHGDLLFDDYDDYCLRSVAKKVGRKIPTTPSRILDAPELVDDYYLNLVSWGMNNVLAVALGQRVYLWNAESGDITHLLTLRSNEDYVTSVAWSTHPAQTNLIAVGTNNAPVQIWDTETLAPIRTLRGHTARVCSLSWNNTLNCLSSGGRDSLIIQHDLRSPTHPNYQVSVYRGHAQEVCGLKWNDDGTTLASGGNENYLCLWDAAMSRRNIPNNYNNGNGMDNNRNSSSNTSYSPRLLLRNHNAAVKALAWCPFHRGLLASGGGTADRTIKFWNTNSGAMLNSIDTGSQVCSLLWSKYNKEICSSHGFSENQLILWKYPTMTKIQEFTGHTSRVLHMEQSPDGATVVSAAADETMRFWDVFGSPSLSGSSSSASGGYSSSNANNSNRKKPPNLLDKAFQIGGGMSQIR